MRARAIILGVLLSGLAWPTMASALDPPSVFLKELDASNKPTGEWIPLANAAMHSVNGYEIGVAVQASPQASNRQRVLVRVTAVPDGHPDQHFVYSICPFITGTAGEIVAPDEHVLYEGDGSYTVSVYATTGSDQSANCDGATPTTGTFNVTAPASITAKGKPILVDWRERPPFGGVVVTPPPGSGGTDILCARDPKPAADGSLTGTKTKLSQGSGFAFAPFKLDADTLFSSVGSWACVARGIGGGVQPGPWSAPTPTRDVQTAFYQARDGDTFIRDFRGPSYVITMRLDKLTAGGQLTVTLKSRGHKLQRIRTRVKSGGLARLAFRLPGSRNGDFYLGSLAFAGTRWVAKRPAFADFAFGVEQQPNGRKDILFGNPCAPHRC